MVNKFPSGSHFIEVGVWMGRSAAYMAVEIINSGKHIIFDIIDNFQKSSIEEARFNLSIFQDYINIVQSDSAKAAKWHQDESIDFVFIDADHSGKAVTRDINAWLPKIKYGGVIAGHDYGNPQYGELKIAVDKILKVKKVSKQCWYYEK